MKVTAEGIGGIGGIGGMVGVAIHPEVSGPAPGARGAGAVTRPLLSGVMAVVVVMAYVIAWIGPARSAVGQLLLDRPPEQTDGVGIDERLGERVPLRLEFTNAEGETAPLSRYFDGERPVILVLGYYTCPVVCPTIFRLLNESLQGVDFTVGEDYRVVVLSVNPEENTTHALTEKSAMLASYDPGNERGAQPGSVGLGMQFLTGSAESIAAAADAVGYRFKRLSNGEYSHPVAIAVLSPDGMVSRYIYGFEYDPFQVKLSLLEASEGRIARSIGDSILHFCYTYDPNAGAYTVQAFTIMRIGAGLTLIGLGVFIGLMFAGERVRRRRRVRGLSSGGPGVVVAVAEMAGAG